jgi:hypothetical protein
MTSRFTAAWLGGTAVALAVVGAAVSIDGDLISFRLFGAGLLLAGGLAATIAAPRTPWKAAALAAVVYLGIVLAVSAALVASYGDQ